MVRCSTNRQLRVGIAGGGIAGLAAAVFLARAGHTVDVFEKSSGIVPDGTGILLQPAGLDVLRRLGLEESAFALGTPIGHVVARARSGNRLMDLCYSDLHMDLRALGIRRPALATLMLEAAQAAGAALHFGTAVEGIGDDGATLIERGSQRTHGPFDVTLVCDGTGSRLRDQVVAGAKVRPHARGVFSMVAPLPGELRADTLLQCLNGMRDGVGLLPIGNAGGSRPLVSFFWNERPRDVPRLEADGYDAWCSYIEGFCPEAREFLHGLSFKSFTFATTAEISLRRWHAGRALVMGDAAHALNPQLGLGATMALLDAECVSRCLSESSTDVPAAHAMFQSLRKPQLDRYARISRLWSRLDAAGLSPLRRWLFIAMANSGVVRQTLLGRVCGYA